MTEKITVSPGYEHLTDFISGLPSVMQQRGEVVQDRRNLIKTIEEDGIVLNIKRFRKPIWINRVAYTFFREPKARKAYTNALTLLGRGFATPAPIALVEHYRGGLLSYSYFVSRHLEDVREIREYYFSNAEGTDLPLLKAFARYTAALHEAEVYHMDYSPGNILINGEGSEARFSLVDINRMKFREVGLKAGCANFARLFEYDPAVEAIAKEYAKERDFDPGKCVAAALKYKRAFEKKKERKLRLKKMLGISRK